MENPDKVDSKNSAVFSNYYYLPNESREYTLVIRDDMYHKVLLEFEM